MASSVNAPSLDRRQQAEKMLEKLKTMEEILLDEEKRKQYDQEFKKIQEKEVTHMIETEKSNKGQIPPAPKRESSSPQEKEEVSKELSSQLEKEKVKKSPFFVEWIKRKKWMIGFLAVLIVALGGYLFQIYALPYAPYKVLFYNEKGELDYKSFWTKSGFNEYIAEHPIAEKRLGIKSSGFLTTFYSEKDGKGSYLEMYPLSAGGYDNFSPVENFSSVRTHSYGDYTYIYEHKNGQGSILAIPNTGDLYNISDIPMKFGVNWRDGISSIRIHYENQAFDPLEYQ